MALGGEGRARDGTRRRRAHLVPATDRCTRRASRCRRRASAFAPRSSGGGRALDNSGSSDCRPSRAVAAPRVQTAGCRSDAVWSAHGRTSCAHESRPYIVRQAATMLAIFSNRRGLARWKLREDLVVLREAVLLLLGEDQLPVHDDVELARLARFDLGVDACRLLDRGRETRGLRLVVSDDAVADGDGHAANNTGINHGDHEAHGGGTERISNFSP